MLGAVGGVEAFRQDDEVRAIFGGFEDFRAGAREVDGFVGACLRWKVSWGVVRGKKGKNLSPTGRGRVSMAFSADSPLSINRTGQRSSELPFRILRGRTPPRPSSSHPAFLR